jgi:hypothetical protein
MRERKVGIKGPRAKQETGKEKMERKAEEERTPCRRRFSSSRPMRSAHPRILPTHSPSSISEIACPDESATRMALVVVMDL